MVEQARNRYFDGSPVRAIAANATAEPGPFVGARCYSSISLCHLTWNGNKWAREPGEAVAAAPTAASQISNDSTAPGSDVAAALGALADAKANVSALADYVKASARKLIPGAGVLIDGASAAVDLAADRTISVVRAASDYAAHYVPLARTLTPGAGILIDGAAAAVNLAANRTISVVRAASDYAAHYVPLARTLTPGAGILIDGAAAAVDLAANRTISVVRAASDYAAHYVPLARTLTPGAGILIDGAAAAVDLAANRTISVVRAAADYAAHYVPLGRTFTPGAGILIDNAGTAKDLSANRTIAVDTGASGVVPSARTLTPGAGILIDGAAAAVNLAANRTISVVRAAADYAAHYVPLARKLTPGAGVLLDNGTAAVDLSVDRTISIDTSGLVASSRQLIPGAGILIDGATAAVTLAANRTISVVRAAADYAAHYVPLGRKLTPGAGVLIDNGTAALDLSADRTISIDTSGIVASARQLIPGAGILIDNATAAVNLAADRTISVVRAAADYAAHYVPLGRKLTPGAGVLIDNGTAALDLSADRTISVDTSGLTPTARTLTPSGGITLDGGTAAVNLSANRTIGVSLSASQVANNSGHASIPQASYAFVSNALSRLADLIAAAVPTSRTLTPTGGITIDGATAAKDMTANRTIGVSLSASQVANNSGHASIPQASYAFVSNALSRLADLIAAAVPTSRTLTPTGGLTIDGGTVAKDMTANRTIGVALNTDQVANIAQIEAQNVTQALNGLYALAQNGTTYASETSDGRVSQGFIREVNSYEDSPIGAVAMRYTPGPTPLDECWGATLGAGTLTFVPQASAETDGSSFPNNNEIFESPAATLSATATAGSIALFYGEHARMFRSAKTTAGATAVTPWNIMGNQMFAARVRVANWAATAEVLFGLIFNPSAISAAGVPSQDGFYLRLGNDLSVPRLTNKSGATQTHNDSPAGLSTADLVQGIDLIFEFTPSYSAYTPPSTYTPTYGFPRFGWRPAWRGWSDVTAPTREFRWLTLPNNIGPRGTGGLSYRPTAWLRNISSTSAPFITLGPLLVRKGYLK